MRFLVILNPAPWKVGNASHFINIERRLQKQTAFLHELRDKKQFELGPYAILNAGAPKPAYVINTESWESLSQTLHEDPMAIYQEPEIHYLGDYDQAMNKHANTTGSASSVHGLAEDVRVDLGLDLPRQRDPLMEVLAEQREEIRLLRAELATLSKHLESTKP